MRKHINAMGFASVAQYLEWCRAHACEASLEKSARALEEERQRLAEERALAQVLARMDRNPARLIRAVCNQRIEPQSISRPAWRGFCDRIAASDPSPKARQSLERLLLTVLNDADFLTESVTFGQWEYRYIDALVQLNGHRDRWVRTLDSWRVSSHNRRRQFSSLARHLFARYPVPAFMDSVWFRTDRGSNRMRENFIHIGDGQNIRKADMPVPFTRRMAHHFLQAPDHYSLENAVRWAQVHSLGGDARLVEAVLGTRLGNALDNDEFWVSVIRFLIDNPLLDRSHVGPIVDFLHAQKFRSEEVPVRPGVVEPRPPPQPNLFMRGRTAQTLLDQVERWHRHLGRAEAVSGGRFAPSGIAGFELGTGANGAKTWVIRELLSTAELVAEGRAMQHCVASYAHACTKGHCSIWTMELHTRSGVEKRQTIEVTRQRTIVQSRGKANRLPTARELNVMRCWADTNHLTLSTFVQC